MTPRLSTSYTPAISVGPDSVVDIVAVDSQGALVHCHFSDGDADPVAARIHDTRAFAGSPALVRRPDGGLHVFCRDVRGHVRHARHSERDGWSAWRIIGATSRPTATCPEPGDFGAGHEQPISSGDREGDSRFLTARVFRPLADVRVAASITAVVCPDGHVELFASDLNRALWRSVEVAGIMAPWRRVQQPGLYTEISAAAGPHGGPVLVGASRDGIVWAGCVDDTAGSGETHPLWSRLDAHVTGAPIILAVRSRYAIFGRGSDARPWQTGGYMHGGWSAWSPISGAPLLPPDARIAGAPEAVGGLRICARGLHGEILYACEAPDGGWSAWSVVPGGPAVSQLNIAADPGQGVHLVGVGPGGRLVRIWHRCTEEVHDDHLAVALR